jgi:hypothetical protein
VQLLYKYTKNQLQNGNFFFPFFFFELLDEESF